VVDERFCCSFIVNYSPDFGLTRKTGVSDLNKFCKGKGNCGLARHHKHESVKAWKKGNTNLNKEREKKE